MSQTSIVTINIARPTTNHHCCTEALLLKLEKMSGQTKRVEFTGVPSTQGATDARTPCDSAGTPSMMFTHVPRGARSLSKGPSQSP